MGAQFTIGRIAGHALAGAFGDQIEQAADAAAAEHTAGECLKQLGAAPFELCIIVTDQTRHLALDIT